MASSSRTRAKADSAKAANRVAKADRTKTAKPRYAITTTSMDCPGFGRGIFFGIYSASSAAAIWARGTVGRPHHWGCVISLSWIERVHCCGFGPGQSQKPAVTPSNADGGLFLNSVTYDIGRTKNSAAMKASFHPSKKPARLQQRVFGSSPKDNPHRDQGGRKRHGKDGVKGIRQPIHGIALLVASGKRAL